MALYLMVRGPKVEDKKFNWKGSRLVSMEASDDLLKKTPELQENWLYMHRVSTGYGKPKIVGKAKVEEIKDKKICFNEWIDLDYDPVKGGRFKSFYEAEPVDQGKVHEIMEGSHQQAIGYSFKNKFHSGDLINHKKFGLGKVLEESDQTIVVSFKGIGKKRLIHNKS